MAPDGALELDHQSAAHFARLTLSGLHREYPNKLSHVLSSDADARPPRELTPVFYGCFDWHSAVHGHWTLVRLLRRAPGAAFEAQATRALDTSFDDEKIAGELRYLAGPGRLGFEVPYGMAWLLTLGQELAEWDDPRALRWHAALAPLERLAAERMQSWAEKLPWPVRTGEHTQSAFGLARLLDWARSRSDGALAAEVVGHVKRLYAADRDGPLHLEPSGYDFLSPCLSEADVMRRVLDADELGAWLDRFLPSLSSTDSRFMPPVVCPDPSDAKLSHLDGLNLSRGWMLDGIASALPHGDRRRALLLSSAGEHLRAGVRAVTGEHYEGSHWQGSFAVYALTRRGLPVGDSSSLD